MSTALNLNIADTTSLEPYQQAFITLSSQRRIPTIFATSCMGMITIVVWLHFFLHSIDDAGTVSASAATLYGSALQEESTQNHHNTTLCPRKVYVKGERHTGTNWVTFIINKNLGEDDEKVIEWKHGWKHGFYPPIGVGAPFYSDEVRVVVTRDAFVWLAKMKFDVYEPMMDEKRRSLSFSEFIRTEYKAICYPEWNEVCKQRNGGKSYERIQYKDQANHWQVKYDTVPTDVAPFERADNMIQMRTQKYKQWLNFDEPSDLTYVGSKQEFLDNTIHIRVDDLLPRDQTATPKELQNKHIGEPLRNRCVPLNGEASFKEHVTYTKFDPVWDAKQIFDPIKEREEMLKLFSKEDINFVLSQLDLDFEMSIGYDYSYVQE